MKLCVERIALVIIGAVLGLLLAGTIYTIDYVDYCNGQILQAQHQIDVLPDAIAAQLNKDLDKMNLDIEENIKMSENEINNRTSACFDDINRTLDKKLPTPKKKHR